MPWLGSVYIAVFAALGISSVYFEYRDGEKRWRIWCDSLAAAILTALFVSHWARGLRDAMGLWAPFLFCLAMGWEMFDTPRELRGVQENQDLSPMEKALAPLFGIGICIPVYIIAGLAAFR